MTSDKLKPCPFCGVTNGKTLNWSECKLYFRWAVNCKHKEGCPLYGMACGDFETVEEATAAWNRRACE